MRETGESQPVGEQRSSKAYALDQGVLVLSYLIGGVAVYGLLGWVADHFLHTRLFLPLGIVLGAALAVYAIIKRFGTVAEPPPKGGGSDDR